MVTIRQLDYPPGGEQYYFLIAEGFVVSDDCEGRNNPSDIVDNKTQITVGR